MSDTLRERLEELVNMYRDEVAGHYDSLLLRAQDGANLAKGIRALLASVPEQAPPADAGLREADLRKLAIYTVDTCDIHGQHRRVEPAILLEQALAALASAPAKPRDSEWQCSKCGAMYGHDCAPAKPRVVPCEVCGGDHDSEDGVCPPAIEAQAEAGFEQPEGTWCPECGPHVKVDEEGLCVSCGATAIGNGANTALRTLARPAPAEGLREAYVSGCQHVWIAMGHSRESYDSMVTLWRDEARMMFPEPPAKGGKP